MGSVADRLGRGSLHRQVAATRGKIVGSVVISR